MDETSPVETESWQLQDLPLDVLVKILSFLDGASLKQLRLASTTLCTAALCCIKQLSVYRRTGSEFGPWDPVESLPYLTGIKLRIGIPLHQDWESYKEPWERTTLTLGARRCLPLLAELVIDGIDWQSVDDASLGRLQHSMQLAPNLTKLEILRCKYLPSTLLEYCPSVCDLEMLISTMLGPLEGPLMALSNLQRLNIRGTDVFGGPSEIRLWPPLLQLVPAYLPKLTDLSHVVLLGEWGLSTLASLHQLTRLRVEVHVEADGLVPMGPLFRMRGLADLYLRVEGPGQFSDYQEGAVTLADLKRATQLRALSLFVFETWEDVPPSALPWHPLCSALTHLTALTQLHVNFPEVTAPTSALRLLALPALITLRLCVRQDAPEDRIWPILYRAAPLLQHLDLTISCRPGESRFTGLVSCLQGLPSLTRLRIANSLETMASEDWPSAACLTCHSGLRYLDASHMFHAANIDRDLPLLTAFAHRHGLAIQFRGSVFSEKMGLNVLQHEWREHVRLSSANPRYSVEWEPLPAPTCPLSNLPFVKQVQLSSLALHIIAAADLSELAQELGSA